MSRKYEDYLSNPFADTTENPFSDPSSNHGRNNGQPYSLNSSEESLSLENVQLSSPYNANTNTTREEQIQISRREQELAQREAQLAQREIALQNQAEELRLHGGKPPNFPPFYPIYYMDINAEIPENKRKIVRHLYQSWLAFLAAQVINFVSSILLWAANVESLTSAPQNFGGALSYMVVMPFPSFFLWYRPIYNAFMKERAFFYFIYFFFNGFHILYLGYMVAGIPSTGSCGILNSIYALIDGKIVPAVFGFITAGLFAALTLFNVFLYIKVHRHCQEVGHSFKDAKSEAVSRVAGSKATQQVATEYARQRYSSA